MPIRESNRESSANAADALSKQMLTTELSGQVMSQANLFKDYACSAPTSQQRLHSKPTDGPALRGEPIMVTIVLHARPEMLPSPFELPFKIHLSPYF